MTARLAWFLLVAFVAALPASEHKFRVRQESEIVATLLIEAPNPSIAVLTVDGKDQQHLPITGIPHRVSLGRLRPGEHTLRLDPNGEHAPQVLAIRGVSIEEQTEQAYARAPIIYSRDRALSDLPLLMYCQPLEDGSLEYTVIFSNEDGGTSTRALMARWGRTTDIEYLYRVWPATGRAIVQGKNHVDTEFTGPYEGRKPVLAVVTRNNMVAAAPEKRDGFRFALAPIVLKDLGGSREAVMDRIPETYAVMATELEREGKLRAFDTVDGEKISDVRNYAFFEYDAQHRNSAFTVAVGLKSGDVYASDLGRADYAISRDGAVRTTVELPPGTSPADIAHVEFRCIVPPANPALHSGTCKLLRVRKAFFLRKNYVPDSSFLRSDTEVTLPTGRSSRLQP